MPLNTAALKSALQAAFASPGATHADVAQAWASAMQGYATAIVPPSTTVAAAATALSASLATAFAAPPSAAAMETAFTAFATSVGLGMAGYTPAPPPAPVGFAALFAGPKPATHADAATQIGDIIDAWMRTGSATLAAPPNTLVVWS